MLVLTRKPGEKIMIGDDIVLSVSEVRGESVRIAIEAPKSVKIFRGELYEAIVRENKQASSDISGSGKAEDIIKKISKKI